MAHFRILKDSWGTLELQKKGWFFWHYVSYFQTLKEAEEAIEKIKKHKHHRVVKEIT